jgi:dihydrofolate reductase
MRKLTVSTLVTLDGVIQDPGGFGETAQGGWGNPYFTAESEQLSYENLLASDYFLCGRVTYELLSKTWGKIKGGPYLERMNAIPKLVASRTLSGPLEWNASLIATAGKCSTCAISTFVRSACRAAAPCRQCICRHCRL